MVPDTMVPDTEHLTPHPMVPDTEHCLAKFGVDAPAPTDVRMVSCPVVQMLR